MGSLVENWLGLSICQNMENPQQIGLWACGVIKTSETSNGSELSPSVVSWDTGLPRVRPPSCQHLGVVGPKALAPASAPPAYASLPTACNAGCCGVSLHAAYVMSRDWFLNLVCMLLSLCLYWIPLDNVLVLLFISPLLVYESLLFTLPFASVCIVSHYCLYCLY